METENVGIYSFEEVIRLLDEDEVSIEEAGFVQGYLMG